jgi:hypothetical protein
MVRKMKPGGNITRALRSDAFCGRPLRFAPGRHERDQPFLVPVPVPAEKSFRSRSRSRSKKNLVPVPIPAGPGSLCSSLAPSPKILDPMGSNPGRSWPTPLATPLFPYGPSRARRVRVQKSWTGRTLGLRQVALNSTFYSRNSTIVFCIPISMGLC